MSNFRTKKSRFILAISALPIIAVFLILLYSSHVLGLNSNNDLKVWGSYKFSYNSDGSAINLTVTKNGVSASVPLSYTTNLVTANKEETSTKGYYVNLRNTSSCSTSSGCQTYIFDPLNNELGASDDDSFVTDMYVTGNKFQPSPILKIDIVSGPATNTNTYQISVSGGDTSAGTVYWNDQVGTPVINPSQYAQGLEFISPTEIYDSNLTDLGGAYYVTDSIGGQFSGQGTNRFLNDGDTLYWPVGKNENNTSQQVSLNGYCDGGISVQTDEGNNYGTTYWVTTRSIQTPGNCFFGTNPDSPQGYPAKHYGTGGSNEPSDSQAAFRSQTLNLSAENKKMLFASWHWQDPNTIKSYNITQSALTTTALPKGTQDDILNQLNIPDSALNNTVKIFSNDTCKDSDTFPTFILVKYDDSNNKLSDLNISSSNSEGYYYFDNNGQHKEWVNAYDENGVNYMDCLFGGSSYAPRYNMIGNSQSSDTYIADVGASVTGGTTIKQPTPTPAPPAAVSSCQGTAGSSFSSSSDDSCLMPQCQTSIFNPLTWFMCPIVWAGEKLVGQLDNGINSMLDVNTCQYFAGQDSTLTGCQASDVTTSNDFYESWNNFRIIAIAIVVIAGLVMVIGQAIGVEVLDAYTFKKMMPRLVVVIIGISLSWYLLEFAVQFSNDLGNGVRFLIYAPFANLATTGKEVLGGGGSAISVLVLSGAGLALGLIGLLSLVVTAVIAVIAAFGLLLFRNLAIIVLIILSPIAIACYALPNTEKVWKLWSSNFTKVLLMFPIITAFIAAGRALAAVIDVNNNDTLDQLMAFALYFAPYFMIPTAFKMAGGTMAMAGNMASRLRSTASKPFTGYAKKRVGDRIQKQRAGGLYNQSTRRGRFGNTLGSFIFNPDEKIPHVLGTHGGAVGRKLFGGTAKRLTSEIEHERMEQEQKLFETINTSDMANDKTFAAMGGMHKNLSAGVKDEFAKAGLLDRELVTQKDYDKAGEIMSNSTEHTERVAGLGLSRVGQVVLNKQRNGMAYANATAAAMLGYAAHGFADEDTLAAGANHIMKSNGIEHADAVAVKSELYGKAAGLKAGYSHAIETDASGNKTFVSGMDSKGGRDWEVVGSMNTDDIAGMKSGAAKKKLNIAADIVQLSRNIKANPAMETRAREMWAQQGLSEHAINSRLKLVHEKGAALESTLTQLAGPYSRAPADTSALARGMIESLNRGAAPDQQIKIPGATDYDPGAVIPHEPGGGPPPGAGGPAPPSPGYTPPGP